MAVGVMQALSPLQRMAVMSLAAICAGLGAKLVLADIGDAAPVAEKLRCDGHQVSAVACDVTDRAGLAAGQEVTRLFPV